MRNAFTLLTLTTLAVVFGMHSADANQERWRARLARLGDPVGVFTAIEEAGARKDVDAALPLLEAMADIRRPHLAVAAGDALREMGAAPLEDKAFVKRLKKLSKAKDIETQKNVARLVAAWGHPDADEYIAHFCEGRRDPEVQVEGLFMAGGLRTEDAAKTHPETTKAILTAVKKGRKEPIKCAGCSAAGRLQLKDAVENLVSLATRSRDDYTGLYAVWALKQMRYTGSLASFQHVLKSNPKKTVLQACLKGVTELSGLQDVDALLGMTRHNKKDYRDAAVLALARLAWRAQRGRLPVAPGEEPRRPRVVTGEETDKPADPFKKHELPDTGLDIPEEVIRRMIAIVRDDDDWEVRDAARQALINFGTVAKKHVDADMPRLVTNNNFDVASTAMELCGIFGCEAAAADLLKIAIFEEDDVRSMFAARALENCDPEGAVKELKTHLRPGKRARDAQLNAVRTLGYIRKQPAFDALLGMLDVGTDGGFNEPMMREAEFALERLTGHRFGRMPERWRKWLATADKPFYPGVETFDRQQNREAVTKGGLYGLSPATESAVETGLRWLEAQQHNIGIWDGAEKGFGGVNNCEPAYTGLSLLAFLGAGYQPREGKFRETVRRSTEFLCATQFYDGGFPVTGGGDQSWIYAYLIAMAVWGINESHVLSDDPELAEPAQWGIDYLVRVQTPGAGWRYGPRYKQSDTSCTSWVMMTVKTADLAGLQVAQRCYDGIDRWLQLCSLDITGEEELIADLASDYDYEVGSRRYFKAFAGYFALEGAKSSTLQQVSMTAVTMVCRFFQGWKRSHPFMIGSSNYLQDYLPQWMKGLEKGMAVAWYHYYWYYGTLAMHQMGGRYWRAWNDKIKRMYTKEQRRSPPELVGSWDPDTAVLNGGRVFSTAMSILSLESYYRFSPLMSQEVEKDEDAPDEEEGGEEKDAK